MTDTQAPPTPSGPDAHDLAALAAQSDERRRLQRSLEHVITETQTDVNVARAEVLEARRQLSLAEQRLHHHSVVLDELCRIRTALVDV